MYFCCLARTTHLLHWTTGASTTAQHTETKEVGKFKHDFIVCLTCLARSAVEPGIPGVWVLLHSTAPRTDVASGTQY